MNQKQHVTEGGIVRNAGYEFIATNVTVECRGEPEERVVYAGICTDNPVNDDIRHTGYNGGRYGGNHLIYTWE